MLLVFPTPYPDELLYSVIARYHRWSGNPSQKETMKDIFGIGQPCAVLDLPNRLEAIASNIPGNTRLTPDRIIQGHTLFPVYRAFLPRLRTEEIRAYMLGDTDGGKIHMSAGVMASGVSAPRMFRYCRCCGSEEREQFGEAYWHREHQIAGVYVCLKHDCPLIESRIVTPSQSSKHRFQELSEQILASGNEFQLEMKHMNKHRAIAESMHWLLCSNATVETLNELQKRYVSQLYRLGMASCSGRISMRDLERAFVDHYSPGFLQAVQCQIEPGTDHWLCRITRKPRTGQHPLRHVLLIGFLGLRMDEFFGESPREIMPFGKGPWPCLNRASDHYRRKIVQKCVVTRDYKNGAPVGTFTCKCGFVYSRRGPDQTENDRYRIGRIKEFSGIWMSKLKDLTEAQTMSLRATARELDVDPATVMKKRMLLNSPDSSHPSVKEIEEETRDQHRYRWLSLKTDNPGLSKTEVRTLCPAAYTWLYRHDRVWLDENSPQRINTSNADYRRIDWELRDLELSGEVTASAERIRSGVGPNRRVTKTALGKEMGRKSWIDKHLNEMPRTKAAIEQEVESHEEFQIRRVYRVAAVYKAKGYTIKKWQLVRKAGLRPDYTDRVHDFIDAVLTENHQWIM